jgi:hypothetical protein
MTKVVLFISDLILRVAVGLRLEGGARVHEGRPRALRRFAPQA